MSRTLLKRTIKKATVPHLHNQFKCVGCGKHLTPGLHRTGSIITGPAFMTREGTERIGTEIIKTERRCGYYRRVKGPLCDSVTCGSNFRTITKPDGSWEPIVKLDPHMSFYNDSSKVDRNPTNYVHYEPRNR